MSNQDHLQTVEQLASMLVSERGATVDKSTIETYLRKKLNYLVTFPNEYQLSLVVERWFFEDQSDSELEGAKYVEYAIFKPDGDWYVPENAQFGACTYIERALTDRILQVAEYISAL